jgi:hypothetical protein
LEFAAPTYTNLPSALTTMLRPSLDTFTARPLVQLPGPPSEDEPSTVTQPSASGSCSSAPVLVLRLNTPNPLPP